MLLSGGLDSLVADPGKVRAWMGCLDGAWPVPGWSLSSAAQSTPLCSLVAVLASAPVLTSASVACSFQSYVAAAAGSGVCHRLRRLHLHQAWSH